MCTRLDEASLRRYELARAGGHYAVATATWWRGRSLRLSDWEIDHLEPWPAYVRRWMATNRRQERSRMKRWCSSFGTVAYEPVTGDATSGGAPTHAS